MGYLRPTVHAGLHGAGLMNRKRAQHATLDISHTHAHIAPHDGQTNSVRTIRSHTHSLNKINEPTDPAHNLFRSTPFRFWEVVGSITTDFPRRGFGSTAAAVRRRRKGGSNIPLASILLSKKCKSIYNTKFTLQAARMYVCDKQVS